tara:strand:+ start:10 stop:414 length:405 start_codon:yes stop_codon:yes gene_type:complete
MASSKKTRRKRKYPAPMMVRWKRSVTTGIKSLAESTWLKFTTGIVLLTSGLDEAVETLFADISALELGAHHGVMVLGFVNILSSLPDMLDGLTGTFLSDDEEEVEHTEDDSQDFARHQEASPPEPAEAEVRKAA